MACALLRHLTLLIVFTTGLPRRVRIVASGPQLGLSLPFSFFLGSAAHFVKLALNALPLAAKTGHAHLHEVTRVPLVLLDGHIGELDRANR